MSLRNCTVSAKDMAGGSYNVTTGIWTGETAGTPYIVRCSIQPMSLNAMSLLPEGRRQLVSYTLFTSRKLNTVKNVETVPGSANPTVVTIRDEGEFEVYSQANWGNRIIPNYETVVQKIQRVAAPVVPPVDED